MRSFRDLATEYLTRARGYGKPMPICLSAEEIEEALTAARDAWHSYAQMESSLGMDRADMRDYAYYMEITTGDWVRRLENGFPCPECQ